MAQGRLSPEETAGLEDVEELGLMTLLLVMVEERGRTKAAEALGVNYKTLVESIDSGRLSRRMRLALQRVALETEHAEALRREQRVEDLQQRLNALTDDLRRKGRELSSSVRGLEGRVSVELKGLTSRMDWLESQLAHQEDSGSWTNSPATRMRPKPPPAGDRLHPEIVTVEPETGEDLVYGEALAAVLAWRQARQDAEAVGDRLSRLRVEERLRELEIELIVTHGLTLPSSTYPWDGLTRGEQVNWRKNTLTRVRRERFWAEVRRSLTRMLTFGLGPK